MSTPVRLAVYAFVIACVVIGLLEAGPRSGAVAGHDNGGATYRLDRASAERAGVGVLDEPTRAATFGFVAGTTDAGRRIFLAAVAGARPQARRLIDLVDGLVKVRFDTPPHPRAVGLTSFDGERFEVMVDLDRVYGRHGVRAASAVILHELGHVVDRALVPDDLVAALDARIPAGERCQPGQPTGACATVTERFADTFAKWAMDDLGVNGTVGYRVLPPVPLAAWGEPLARLAG